MAEIKLNLGAGASELPSYTNLDIQTGTPAYPLAQYEDDSVDEVRASHILEHFGHPMTFAVLAEWIRVLKPGGLLKIAVPDFELIVREYLKGIDRPDEPFLEEPNFDGWIMGGWVDEYDRHGAIFDEHSLKEAMEQLGLESVRRWKSDAQDCSSLPVSLNLMGWKREDVPTGTKALENIAEQQYLAEHPIKRQPFQWLADRARNVYSQTGEDGFLEAIFEKIGANNRWCFEVGAGDGILCSNTRHLIEQGWKGILVEQDEMTFRRLHSTYLESDAKSARLPTLYKGAVSTEQGQTVDDYLAKSGAPHDIDLCILDVDGQEWHLWNSMIRYRPRVMIVEYCRQAPADYIPARGGEGQAGRDAIVRLGMAKGYEPVVCTNFNLIFVKRPTHEKLMIDAAEVTQEVQAPAPTEFSAVQWGNEPKLPEDTAVTLTGTQSETPTIVGLAQNVAAVMTVPRLMHTEAVIDVTHKLLPLKVSLEYALGVFWGQCLSRVMRTKLAMGVKYILTVDYDSVFCASDVIDLYTLMEQRPEIDALIPVQMKRGGEHLLFHMVDDAGRVRESVPFAELRENAVRVRSGHFGLTMLRTESLARMPHPWFMPVPDPATMEWDEGRIDEDVNFWLRWQDEAHNSLYLAPRVVIGHLEQCVTWPARDLTAIRQLDRDYTKNGKPNGVWR